MRTEPEVCIIERHLRLAMLLGAEFVIPTTEHLRPGFTLDISVQRITFRTRRSNDQSEMVRCMSAIERQGRRAILLTMTCDPVTRRTMLVESKVCRGWTLAFRGGIYSFQAVIFPKPVKTALMGEADQGEIYAIEPDQLRPWDALTTLRSGIAA